MGTIIGLSIFVLVLCIILAACCCGGGSAHYDEGHHEHHTVEVVQTTTEHQRLNPAGLPVGYQAPGQAPPMAQQSYAYCHNGHAMQYTNKNHYVGANNVTCDSCKQFIPVAYWYHHCFHCEADLCQNCGTSRMR